MRVEPFVERWIDGASGGQGAVARAKDGQERAIHRFRARSIEVVVGLAATERLRVEGAQIRRGVLERPEQVRADLVGCVVGASMAGRFGQSVDGAAEKAKRSLDVGVTRVVVRRRVEDVEDQIDAAADVAVELCNHPVDRRHVAHRVVESVRFEGRQRRCRGRLGRSGILIRLSCEHAVHLLGSPTMNGDPTHFEEPILRLRRQIEEATATYADPAQIEELQANLTKVTQEIFTKLTPWQKTLVARHPLRPYTLDFIASLFEEWSEIHGDRKFGDDAAIVTGFARFRGQPCAVVGHQKGRNTKEKIVRNFGQPRPEGFRKALRLMKMAEKFKLPIFTFIDTQGAYPGVGAEERGQAEAIAMNLREMAGLQVPVIVSVIGEGGSGGALALAVGDRIFMLEHAVYSVISPEGCAAILWKNPANAAEAAAAMKITAHDLKRLGIIDEIVPEPIGGAHADSAAAAQLLGPYLEKALKELLKLKPAQLPEERFKKFRKMGVYEKA
jgi:acetyl-CoA carboxylase carboxyl transferase subunit alpha